jgi:predicted nucleic acid-binding protein
MAFVADNSVVVAWFVEPQADDYTRAMLHRSIGETVYVPAVWQPEFANAMVSLAHRRRLKPTDIPRILDAIERMDVETDNAPPSARALVELARRHALSAYDACYLELAIRRQLLLAVRDGPLRKAAHRAGILLA